MATTSSDGRGPGQVYNAASRRNLARRVRAEPGYLDGKRAVIWCFSALALTGTEEGWIPIPL